MTSATDDLRRLLDERGVEWIGTDFTKPTKGHPTSTSLDEELHDAVFIEYHDGNVLRLFDLTPEQAVEATLGRGTCHDVAIEGEWFECSECGCVRQLLHPHYCPNCGRKVIE